MRLSTLADRDEASGLAVLHAALDAGARLLDTADAYCLDESERGHNERLIARALREWPGDASSIEVATKGGLRRPGGRWVPDGRAGHLREACEASCGALGVDAVDLYQLHAVDPRTKLETSVRALASLRDEGLVRRIGLCNVTVSQIEVAREIVEISSVQAGVGVLDDANLRNGVATYCRDHGIRLLAHRPLGGTRVGRVGRHPALQSVARSHGVSPYQIALAWLLDLDPAVVPLAGATRPENARSAMRAGSIVLTPEDRAILDAAFPAGRLLRIPISQRRPAKPTDGEVVLVMGAPGAGKSTIARELTQRDYGRLNRDDEGGSLSDLVRLLDEGLETGRRRWVLDNTYPTRHSRNEVIECAWSHGVPVRCIWLRTSIPDAQINAVRRMLAAHGTLPSPAEVRDMGKADTRFFGPDAQFRYERQLEPPTLHEGFESIEERAFERESGHEAGERAIVFEFDDVLCAGPDASPALAADDVRLLPGRQQRLKALGAEGWRLAALAWRPQIGSGDSVESDVRAAFDRARTLLDVEIEIAFCPHVAGPPVCWCRKPLPGLVLEFAHRHRVNLDRSTLVGRSPADRTLAERLGMSYVDRDSFFDPL